jgi:2-polyprenyl-3-methyl-5-hydroxy-6-metoxy-1,4-benzoquinol methylase
MNTVHYRTKEEQYFTNIRMDVVSLIPKNPNQKILEIGAGSGNTLLYMKKNGLASEVMGVELMHISASTQEHELIDKFQIANIELEEINAPTQYFDVIICADVLEHLVDPWAVIKKISNHLKKEGLLIVSMPNLREWKTISKVVFRGDFSYNPEGGIMDKTHLRFFCKKNIIDLLTSSELTPIYIRPNFMLEVLKQGKKRRLINKFTFRLFENFLAVQYLVIVKKK